MKKLILVTALILSAAGTFAQDAKCKATTKKGTQCTRKAQESGYCRQHDPASVKCAGKKADGTPCSLIPKKGETYCHFHKPQSK